MWINKIENHYFYDIKYCTKITFQQFTTMNNYLAKSNVNI